MLESEEKSSIGEQWCKNWHYIKNGLVKDHSISNANLFMKNSKFASRLKKQVLFLAGAAILGASPVCGEQPDSAATENPYDLLGRTLVPIASIFSQSATQHGLKAKLVLEEMTSLPPSLAGSRFDLAIQPPEQIILRGSYEGEPLAICRDGQEVWVSPGAKFETFRRPPAAPAKSVKKKNLENGLSPLSIPFSPEQLVLLPILFQVADRGGSDGVRILDVQLMPQLARHQHVEEWTARLTIDANGKPVRIEVSRPGWHIILKVEQLAYEKTLPASTWTPGSEDVMHLTAPEVQEWAESISEQVNERQNTTKAIKEAEAKEPPAQ